MSRAPPDEYYPFGMMMPGRKFSLGDYQYGFNGKENDNEVKGEANQINFDARMYDPRIAKWLSLDPLQRKYPSESNYLYTGGNPILFVDQDGKERILFITVLNQQSNKNTYLKVKLSNEIKSQLNRVYYSNNSWHSGSSYYDEYKWNDINMHLEVTIDKKGTISIQAREEKGKLRTKTSFNNEQWARLWVAEKGSTRKAGIVLSSTESRHNWDNQYEPGAENIDGIIDITKIISAFEASKTASSIENKTEDVIEILEYLSNAKSGGESIGESIEAVTTALERIPDVNTTHCKACGKNFKKDENGNPTWDESKRAARDTTGSHNEKSKEKRKGN